MPYFAHEFVSLVVRERPNGDLVTLFALRPTAAFYGWLDAFEEWKLRPAPGQTRFSLVTTRKGPWNPHVGGRRLTICRSDRTSGSPAGRTNVFRVSSDASNKEIALIALNTSVPFGWMEDKRKRRISREEWLQYASSARI